MNYRICVGEFPYRVHLIIEDDGNVHFIDYIFSLIYRTPMCEWLVGGLVLSFNADVLNI